MKFETTSCAEDETKEKEQNEDRKLLEKCKIQINEASEKNDADFLTFNGVSGPNFRASVIETVLDEVQFNLNLDELLSKDREKLWNAVTSVRNSITKLKSAKQSNAGDRHLRIEALFLAEKFLSKINLFILSLFQTQSVPSSVYLDLLVSFFDLCGIVTLAGETFRRKSVLAGEAFSGSPDFYLLALNKLDASLKTIGILSYSKDSLDTESEFKSQVWEDMTVSAPSPIGKEEDMQENSNDVNIPKRQLNLDRTQEWVQNLPATYHSNAEDESQTSSCCHNAQNSTSGMFSRKRDFEGRVKQPAVKLNPANCVINKIPIIITLAPDIEKLDDSNTHVPMSSAPLSLKAGRMPDPSFQSAGRKLEIPSRFFSGLRSAMQQEFPSAPLQTMKPDISRMPLPIVITPTDVSESKLKLRENNAQLKDGGVRESYNTLRGVVDVTSRSYDSKENNSRNEEMEYVCNKKARQEPSQSVFPMSTSNSEDKFISRTVDQNEASNHYPECSKTESVLHNILVSDLEANNIRNSAGNNQNTSSQVNCSKVNYCNMNNDKSGLTYDPVIPGFGLRVHLDRDIHVGVPRSKASRRKNGNTMREQSLPLSKQHENNKMDDGFSFKNFCYLNQKETRGMRKHSHKTHNQRYIRKTKIRKPEDQGDLEPNNCIEGKQNTKPKTKLKNATENEKHRRKNTDKDEKLASSDSGLPDSSGTGCYHIDFHGRFDSDSHSSDSFPRSYLEENDDLKSPYNTTNQMIVVTPQNSMYSVIRFNSEFLKEPVFEAKKFEANRRSCNDITWGYNDNFEIVEENQRTFTRLKSVDWILQQPLETPDTVDVQLSEFSIFDGTLDLSTSYDDLNRDPNFIDHFIDKNFNALTTTNSRFPVAFIQSLLLEWPNSLTKPKSVGFILHKTKVVVAVLEMEHQHYEHLVLNSATMSFDSAKVKYTRKLDLLQKTDRKTLAMIASSLASVRK